MSSSLTLGFVLAWCGHGQKTKEMTNFKPLFRFSLPFNIKGNGHHPTPWTPPWAPPGPPLEKRPGMGQSIQEWAKSARGGTPSVKTSFFNYFFRTIDVFSTFFGRTDLRKGVSRAKFREESDFEVRLAVAPQNLGKNVEKRCATAKKIANNFF